MKNTIHRDFRLKTFPTLKAFGFDLNFRPGLTPIFGSLVQCGLFGISEDHIEKYLSIDSKFISNPSSTFIFRATGNSMEPVIFEDDYLIVDRAIMDFNNRVCIVDLNGERMCKYYTTQRGLPVLHSFNPRVKDIYLSGSESLEIFGVVTVSFKELNFENLNKCTRL